MSRRIVHDGRLRGWVAWALVALLAVVFAGALALGRYPMGLADLAATLLSRIGGEPVNPQLDAVVFGLRLPRTVLAVVVGAGLATAGAAFQSLFSNPLATPDTLGVTAGASVGAVVAMLLSLPMVGVQLVSLCFGIASVGLTMTIARQRGRSSIVMLVLAGVVVAAIASAVLSMLKLIADPNDKLPQITYWLMGSLAAAKLETIAFGAPLIVLGIGAVFLVRWRLNILALGEDEAKASGTNVRAIRSVVVVAATLITASSVSMCGQVGWVGLLIPHIARMICGSNNRLVVPLSIGLGAIFLVVIDVLARTLTASEIPISVITAFVGAPVFIVLLRRTGRSAA